MINKILDIKSLLIIGLLCIPLFSMGVTQKEMEEARTIAAKAYIRYANDGSGYLDEINPKTMDELEAALKPKEKENIKAFKAIPVPTDYKAWDKEKLVEYWAVTAFQNKGLLEKGKGGRIRARSQINKMTIAPPQETAGPVSSTVAVATPETVQSASTSPVNTTDSLLQVEQATIDEEANEEIEPLGNIDKATNYTWVYIMVLAILVAIVVVLVVYAANVMKKPSQQNPYQREPLHDAEEDEHLESLLADKDVEIAMLKKKLESANKLNSDLKLKVETLTAELNGMKSTNRSNELHSAVAETKPQVAPIPSKPALRSIFLGRANIRGIFVRADRTLNIGNSVFVLETSDGYSGSFKVADSPAAWSLALSNPREYLETACTGYDLEDTAGASRIVTESSGTAIFEGGCWKVIRKAKIRYE